MQALAQNIERVNRVKVEVLPANLGDPQDLARVCLRLSESKIQKKPAVGLLVNNAGFGQGKPFLDNDFNEELLGLDVMVRAVMATSYYAGRDMRERGRGAIINISSVAADTGMGPYSAHKSWVRAFSEGLAEELMPAGVNVTAVMPGLVRTEFHERAGTDFSAAKEPLWLTPERVVRESLDASRRGQVLVTPTMRYKVITQITQLMPRSLVRSATRRMPHM